ncbi:MAG: HNH endonuclease [Proteobacteria bacterium]|jgi:hypothetical protein|nr:HNH endonuclease [Pseudomonadota bacterium]
MIVSCNNCNKTFKRKPSEIGDKVFCCRKCFNEYKEKTGWRLNPKTGSAKLCENCGVEIYVRKAERKRFCSRKCSGEWASKNLRGERASNYKNSAQIDFCKICGKKIVGYRSRSYCSQKCMGLGKRNRDNFTCAHCGIRFERAKSVSFHSKERGSSKQFCSRKCAVAHNVGINHPQWIKDRTKLKDKNRSLRYSKEMDEWRIAVFKRDDHTCQKCNKRGGYLNAHHIHTFAACPSRMFDTTNGITLCKKCHRKVTRREEKFVSFFESILRDR